MAKVIKLPSAYVIDTKVVGVSKANADGSQRQDIIKEGVFEDDLLELRPEPDNPYDANAVAVFTKDSNQIGYLSREVAERLHNVLNGNLTVAAKVTWVSGEKTIGVGLRIELAN